MRRLTLVAVVLASTALLAGCTSTPVAPGSPGASEAPQSQKTTAQSAAFTLASYAPPVTSKPDSKPAKRKAVNVTVEPGPGRTVGVGYPIIVRFSEPIEDKAAAQAGLSVSVNQPTAVGSWAWIEDDAVYYRPKDYWPGHAKITVTIDLAGTDLGKNGKTSLYGAADQDRSVTFKTGKRVISYVNAKTHRMKVTIDGKTVKNFGVSLGKPGFETRSGVKVVHEKYVAKRMTSQALGLTNETYDLIAPYAVRITPTGEFVHGAPWASGRIGVYNGSHGCTNLQSWDAKWFYYNAGRTGDVVESVGTRKKMETWNGLGGPWNYTWKQWLKMSAIPGSQSSPGPAVQEPTTPSATPTPAPVTEAPSTPEPVASASPAAS